MIPLITPMQNHLPSFFRDADARWIRFMAKYGVQVLRISLAIVFIWFGALKLFGVSPVADLVAKTIYWFPPEKSVPILGGWEVLIGLGLLTGKAMRLTLLLFWLQLAGTFLVLVLRPEVAFQQGNPLMLTVVGEFVIKNLVLIAASMVIGGTIHTERQDSPAISK